MNITDILDKHGIPYRNRVKNVGKDFIGLEICPFCNSGGYHCGINLKKPYYNCWICSKGKLEKLLVSLLKISYKKAKRIIDKCYTQEIEDEEEEIAKKDESEFIQLYSSFPEIDESHKKYLISRRFDPEEIKRKWKIKGSDILSKYKYRIVIPIFYQNQIVNFAARDITDKQKNRYEYCSNEISMYPKRELCYNLDSQKDSVVLVEGIFDVWRLGDKACAVLSTQFSKEQIFKIIKKKFKRIFIIFDSEEQAQEKARKLGDILSTSCDSVEVIDIGSGDPGDLSEDDAKYLMMELKL